MGLMPHERESHKLTLEAYDRLLAKFKKRKEALKTCHDFINRLIVYAEQRGDQELKQLCMAFLMIRKPD